MQIFFNLFYKPHSALLSLLFIQDCLLGSARCIVLQCPLHSFSGQAVLKVHARLWNSSFIEVKKKKKEYQSQ